MYKELNMYTYIYRKKERKRERKRERERKRKREMSDELTVGIPLNPSQQNFNFPSDQRKLGKLFWVSNVGPLFTRCLYYMVTQK